MKPVKPSKPRKNQPEPSRQRYKFYDIYTNRNDEYLFVDQENPRSEENDDYYQVYDSVDKILIKKIESTFSQSIDYSIEFQDGYDAKISLKVLENVSDEEYKKLYDVWLNRFDLYEEELKSYNLKFEKWQEEEKERKLNNLKKQLAKLER